MIERIQMLSRGQRIFIFFMVFGGGLALMAAIVLLLISFTINTQPRAEAVAVVDAVTVGQFVELPGDEAYPASIAGSDTRIYTGSYVTGAVYEIELDGTVRTLPDTEELIGSVTGITVSPDGTLYVLDRLTSNPRSAGGVLWRFRPGSTPEQLPGFAEDETGLSSPDDVLALPDGRVLVTDRGRREIIAYDAEGNASVFWSAPEDDTDLSPTGLAYDSANDAIILTDSSDERRVYRIALETQETTLLYTYDGNDDAPLFDGVAIADDGVIYIAALEGGIVELRDGVYTQIATNFRGASDVALLADRLYVTNFDSASIVSPLQEPQLPFALDVIELNP